MISRNEMCKALEERHGKDLQDKFSAARVAVCGLGGLGSNIALSLARAGIGTLHLIDYDRVDISNLNRQQYKAEQIGMLKTEAIKLNILEAVPYCRIITDNVKLCAENIPQLLKEDDIICEAFDGAESKAELVDTVLEKMPQCFVSAASGMSGLHSVNSIRTRRFGKRLYISGDSESSIEKDGTLFAPRVMLCAAHQASTVLRIIAEKFDV